MLERIFNEPLVVPAPSRCKKLPEKLELELNTSLSPSYLFGKPSHAGVEQ